MLKKLGLWLLLAAPLWTLAQSEAEFLPHSLHADSLKADLTVLTSREMAGRGTEQSGYQQAANFVSDRLLQWGLESFENMPLVEDGNPYGLSVPYHASQLRNASFTAGRRKYKMGKDFVATGALTHGLNDFDEIVVIGHGKTTEKGTAMYQTEAVKGKWVLAAPGTLNAKGEIEESFWREQYRQLVNAGAAGVLVMHQAYKKRKCCYARAFARRTHQLAENRCRKGTIYGQCACGGIVAQGLQTHFTSVESKEKGHG